MFARFLLNYLLRVIQIIYIIYYEFFDNFKVDILLETID